MIARKSVAKRRKEALMFFAIGVIPVIYIAATMTPLINIGLAYAIAHLDLWDPLYFGFDLEVWGSFLLIYFVAFLFYVSSIKNTRFDEEGGSGQFADPIEMGKKYEDKKKYPLPDHNLSLVAETEVSNKVIQKDAADEAIDDEPDLFEKENKGVFEDLQKERNELAASQKFIDKVNPNDKRKPKPVKKVKRHDTTYNNMNKIITENVRLSLDGYKTRKNLNMCVIGGSGAGKTRFVVKPNILQGNTSFIVLDPKGELLRDTGFAMKKMGYSIKVLNLRNLRDSDCYNPFMYLRDDTDIQHLVDNLFKATGETAEGSDGKFFDDAAKVLLSSLVSFCHYFLPEEEQNFSTVTELLRLAQLKSEDISFKSELDLIFEHIENTIPADDHRIICVKYYKNYRNGAAKTLQSVQTTLSTRLSKFDNPDLQKLTSTDMLDLDSVGQKKTIIYAIIPVDNEDLNFLVSILYIQLFQRLFYVADTYYDGSLPVHVQFIMDEFANVQLPKNFDKIVSVVRSYNISVTIILQSKAQISKLFKDEWEGIIGNCDTFLYLGNNEHETHKYLSDILGKETIYTQNTSESHGRNGSFTNQNSKQGREMAMAAEVRVLNHDDDRAIILIRDEYPIIDKKYNLMKHPNIILSKDGGAPRYYHNQLVVEESEYLSEEELKDLFVDDTFEASEGLQIYTSEELVDIYLNPSDRQESLLTTQSA